MSEIDFKKERSLKSFEAIYDDGFIISNYREKPGKRSKYYIGYDRSNMIECTCEQATELSKMLRDTSRKDECYRN